MRDYIYLIIIAIKLLIFMNTSAFAQDHSPHWKFGFGYGPVLEKDFGNIVSLNTTFSLNQLFQLELEYGTLHESIGFEKNEGHYFGSSLQYFKKYKNYGRDYRFEEGLDILFYYVGLGAGSYDNRFIYFINAGFDRLIFGENTYLYIDLKFSEIVMIGVFGLRWRVN